jgi:hypothetical protein
MIIEELVARLGFDVRGTDKLKAAQRGLDQYRTALGRFADAAKAKLAAYGIATERASRSTTVFAASNARAARAGTALRTIFIGLARAAAVVGVGIAGIATAGGVGAAFLVALAGKAAKAREELQLLAASQGTKAGRADLLGNFFGRIGDDGGRKTADGIIKSLSGKIRESGEDEETREKLRKAGLPGINKDGTLPDTAIAGFDAVRRIARLSEQARGATGAKKGALNKDIADTADLIGLDGASLERIKRMNEAQVVAALQEAGRLRPSANDADEADAARRAGQWTQLSDNLSAVLDGLLGRLGELRDAIADKVIGPFLAFSEGLVGLAKRFGWIKETEGERNSRTEFEREATRGSGARRGGTVSEDLQLRVNRLEARRKEIEAQPESRGRARSLTEIEAAIQNAIRDLKASTAAPGPDQRSMIDWLNESMTSAGSKIAAAFEAGTAGQRNYENIGNDQRTQSVSVHVTASGLGEVAGAVGRAVSSSLVKGSTATTAAAGVGP